MTVRYYSSVAAETSLVASITNAQTSIQVVSVTGLPPSFPYTLSLDYEGITEELVDVTASAGTTLTVTRGVDGTSATTHAAAARVRHVSSGRDHADSRAHENADDGIHGLAVGDVLVGEDKVQTLSNKTLDMATGTLNRIDIFNTGSGVGWQTTINGDAAFPSTNLLALKPTSAGSDTFTVANNGTVKVINKDAGQDASSSDYRIRVTKFDGTTDIFRVLSSGVVRTKLSNGSQGYECVPENDTAGGTQRAFTITTSDASTVRSSWLATGEMNVTSISPAAVTLQVNAAASQTADAFRVRNNAASNLFNVTSAGNVTVAGTSTLTGTVTANTITTTTAGIAYKGVVTGIQNVTGSGTEIDTAVSFGVTFGSAPRVFAIKQGAVSGSPTLIPSAVSVTTTGFTLRLNDGGGTSRSVTALPVAWQAVSQ